MQRISPCLWFDTEAEAAANFYTGVFKNSKIKSVTHYGEAGPMPAGTVMVVTFELDGVEFIALNGGPIYKFSEAVSLSIGCRTQAEVDHYWDALNEGRRGRSMRLAQGQVRPVMAGGAARIHRADGEFGCQARQADDASDDEDEEAQPRPAQGGVRCLAGMRPSPSTSSG